MRFSTRRFLIFAILLAALATIAILVWRRPPSTNSQSAKELTARGGHLLATVRSEPRSFNRLVVRDRTSHLLSVLTQARLVRLNPITSDPEPWLAERWESTDGRRFLLHLRRGIAFSDGAPFTSADVVFTFQALYDESVGSPLAEAFKSDGRPIGVRAIDEHTVELTWPGPQGSGLRALDSLPILPRHRLESSLRAGTFRDSWNLTTAPSEIAGLGPFVLTRYDPGARLELERNPHYWRRTADDQPQPLVDRVTLQIVPDQNTEILQLESGESDLTSGEVRPDDVPSLKKRAAEGRVQLHELGVGLNADFFWINLSPERVKNDPRRAWLQRRELRQAISHAVDRQQFVDTVFLGAATPIHGPVTPANRYWYVLDLPRYDYDLTKAAALLASIGLTDRNGDGLVEDASGTPARLSLFTQKGHAVRERAAAVLKEDLRGIGLTVDLSTFDQPTLIGRLTGGDYDAIYFGADLSDTDPAANLDYWLSSGAFHAWHPSQSSSSTEWEREIDDLMHKQVTSTDPAERKRLFGDVQRIFARELPAVYFAAPHVTIATSPRVAGAQPALLAPHVLWNADSLAVRTATP